VKTVLEKAANDAAEINSASEIKVKTLEEELRNARTQLLVQTSRKLKF